VYPPVRQSEQYEFARHLQQLSRPETVRPDSAVSAWQRTWLAVGALVVVVAVVASYAVAASI
jgi:hypothetical protein